MSPVAVMDQANPDWSAGGEYSRVQARCLAGALGEAGAEREVLFVTRGRAPEPGPGDAAIRAVAPPELPTPGLAARTLARLTRQPYAVDALLRRGWERWADRAGVDAVLSHVPEPWYRPGPVAACGWIPDFQHVTHPGFFSEAELAAREVYFRRVAETSDRVVLSSEAVREDFVRFAPGDAGKARVWQFPSRFAFEPPPREDPAATLRRFGIRMGFLLVVNQFWAHKNHACVVEAMGRLRREGRCPQVVMIGMPVDYRDRTGRTLSGVLGRIAELGLEGHAKLLGFVDSAVRDALLRACRALIQPSLVEGWSTSVEDARALGRPVLTADTAVLREQAPEAFGRFAPDDPATCAALMDRAGQELPPGPDPGREAAALERAHAAAREAGRRLRTIVEEARRTRDARLGRTPEGEAP